MGVVTVKEFVGSTSFFNRVEDGMILKSLYPAVAERDAYKVTVERKILERLGEHPRIIRYMGFRDNADISGLLFAEASHGNLQKYIDQNNDSISLHLRENWCIQVTEGIQYLHSNGVIHSDLRPENCLVHKSKTSLEILLCDFGGSICLDLGLDGKGLPDPPFWDMVWESTTGTGIFGLGSTFYTIITGHWPYKSAHPSEEDEDKWQYEDRVIDLLKQGVYPNVESVIGGRIMIACWKKQYLTAEDVLQAQKVELWDIFEIQAQVQQDPQSGTLRNIYQKARDFSKH